MMINIRDIIKERKYSSPSGWRVVPPQIKPAVGVAEDWGTYVAVHG